MNIQYEVFIVIKQQFLIMALISKLFIRFIIGIIVRFIISLTMRVTSLSLSDSSDELGSKSSPISFSISVDFIPYLHSSKIV